LKKQSQFKANYRALAGKPKHETLNPKQDDGAMIRWIHLRISRMNPYFVQNRNGITKIGLD